MYLLLVPSIHYRMAIFFFLKKKKGFGYILPEIENRSQKTTNIRGKKLILTNYEKKRDRKHSFEIYWQNGHNAQKQDNPVLNGT